MVNNRSTHLLVRHQELALKGKNRPEFERRLLKNLARCVGDAGRVHSVSGRFVIDFDPRGTAPDTIDRVAAVGGVSAVTPCAVVAPAMEAIESEAIEWARGELAGSPDARTFAVRTRRIDKRFPLSSAQIDAVVGTSIKKLREGLTVDLKRPDMKIRIEVRHKHALVYSWEKAGVRGLPMDATQRVVCLLSGGIDSPVAAYEVMRRGCTPILMHFHSKPFSSEASISKVKRLAAMLRALSPLPLELWLVPLLAIQKAVRDTCNERYRTVHYRRFMMMAAQELATRRDAKALVTGEALGQVASQTLSNMQAIDAAVRLPVLRPLVTADKDQIITKAKQLGTYEISIEPHDDSCVLFAPRRPATQARLAALLTEEEMLPAQDLVLAAVDAAEKLIL